MPSSMPWEAGGEIEAEEAAEEETEHLCSRADTMPRIADVLPVPGGPWTESGIRVQISRRERGKNGGKQGEERGKNGGKQGEERGKNGGKQGEERGRRQERIRKRRILLRDK
jgi:hypothetical protein